MSKALVYANEATASRRRVYFDLRDATDGITPETGEGGGQPQVSSDGAAWTNTGIGTLTHIGNGRYYADLTQTLVATTGTLVETRFKSANTVETPGDSVQVVAFNPNDAVSLGLTAVASNVVQISGDATAADNFETMLDGTGGQTLSLGRFVVVGGDGSNPTMLVRNTTAGGVAAWFEHSNGGTSFAVGLGDPDSGSAISAYASHSSGYWGGCWLGNAFNGAGIGFEAYGGNATSSAGTDLGRFQTTGGRGAFFWGGNAAGTVYYQTILGTGSTIHNSVGSAVFDKYTVAGSTYSYDNILANNLTLGGNVSVAGTTALTGAVTATNASNDIRGVRLSATSITEVAVSVLTTDLDTVEATTAIHSLCSAALKLVSKFDALTGITYRTDGLTTHMTQTPTTDNTMVPIRSLDKGV